MAENEIVPPGSRPPHFTLLSDHPILNITDEIGDLLDLHERLSVHLDTLRHPNTQTPFTMTLYGDWGTGKTSAMRWLESQLQIWNASPDRDHDTHPHLTPVWFYPWKYHQREDVWRGIIAEVILATLSISGDSAPPLPQRLAAAGKQFGKFLGHSFLHALANVKIKATAAGTGAELSGQIFQDLYNEYNQSARPHAPFLNDFEQQLTQWVRESFDGKKRRLVLFIDDLDRCLPGVALEVLEALKLYLNIPGLLFVVGLDRDVIDQLVIKHYQDNGVSPEKAAKYLAKLFQVEMDIHPSDHQSADFLTRKLAALDSFTGGIWNSCLTPGLDADAHVEKFRPAIESVITLLSRGNPREFTRLLNALLVKAGSAQASKGKPTPNIRFLQGAQSFLIERLLEERTGLPHLLRYAPYRIFLENLSAVRRANPDLSPYQSGPRSDGKSASHDLIRQSAKRQVLESAPDQGSATPEFASIVQEAAELDSGPLILRILEEKAWDLLLIPFSPEIAAATSSILSTRPATRSVSSGKSSPPSLSAPSDINNIPREVLAAAASNLDLPIDHLTLELLGTVTGLGLENSKISDLKWAPAFPKLGFLDLSDTQVSDLSPLSGISGLRNLDLDNTQVSDLSPLSGISGLMHIFLRGTPVSRDETAIAQLRKALPNLEITMD